MRTSARNTLLPLAICAALFGAGCDQAAAPENENAMPVATETPARPPEPAPAAPAAPAGDAQAAAKFVEKANAAFDTMYPEATAAQWVSVTYINPDSQLLAAKANERWLGQLNGLVEESKPFLGPELNLDPATRRSLNLLRLSTAMPAPKDPAKLAQLTKIATQMEGAYGAGEYCTGEGEGKTCRDLGELSNVLRDNRDYAAQLEAWKGWRTISPKMRDDYRRFAELVNEGASEIGFANAGEMWRAGYDMSPAEFETEANRLWGQVKPLYDDLQCYVRGKLEAKYGEQGSIDGMIPAHLTGNMWAQQWGNIWDVVDPGFKGQDLDLTAGLVREGYDAEKMVRRAEDFYTSLGMPALPETFYTQSQFLKPRDREVVCHASAWPMDYHGDVRIKMCIEPNEEEFTTIYHELGHIYYYLLYKGLPPLFQSGAHDGFHEAIGDTIVLSMTPEYLASIGLVKAGETSDDATISGQLRMALDKVAFLPFSMMIDQWRWGVFDGRITPGNYNRAWWELRQKYQGVAAPEPRGEEFFDPGAKYHVPGNTPYARYFLSHILQFQFYRSLCEAAGHQGPLHTCSFYGNEAAGAKFRALLAAGQSQPWQDTLQTLTGKREMDATAILDYFAPLAAWLKTQNEGKTCGWNPEGGTLAAATLPVAIAPAEPATAPASAPAAPPASEGTDKG